MTIDDYIKRRNGIQRKANTLNESVSKSCWARMGVANRHIDRVLSGKLELAPGVEWEIERSLRDTESWLK